MLAIGLAKPKSLPKPLRPLRPSLCDPCVFCFSKFTLLLFALFTLIKTQRTRRHSQSSQRRYREILPLCVLRGLHSATFAFLADPRRNVFSLSAVALTQRTQRCFAKFTKTLPRKLPNQIVKHQPATRRIGNIRVDLNPKMHRSYKNAQNAQIDTECTKRTNVRNVQGRKA